MLLQILTHTPRWVFGLFVLLFWMGSKQLMASTFGLRRVTVMPIAMTGLSVYGVITAFGDSPLALAGWAAAAVIALTLVLQRPLPPATRYDAGARLFHVPGTAVPLILMMGIFFTKYVVGVSMVMHPELAHNATFAVAIPLLYGAFSGIFTGRGLRLWQLAIRQDRVLAGTTAA